MADTKIRFVKVVSTTYIPAYTPEHYANGLAGTKVDFELPTTLEDCVAFEQRLLNDPTCEDLSLEIYTESAVLKQPIVALELMPEGFVPEGADIEGAEKWMQSMAEIQKFDRVLPSEE
jgi:hypothetical protein